MKIGTFASVQLLAFLDEDKDDDNQRKNNKHCDDTSDDGSNTAR